MTSNFLSQAINSADNNGEVGGNAEDEPHQRSENTDASFASHAKLYNKLRAVEFEINAVSSTVEQARNVACDDHAFDEDDSVEKGDKVDGGQASPDGLNLQHALATDRLRSLKKTKAQIEKELSDLCKNKPSEGIDYERLISNIVKADPKPKTKSKGIHKSVKSSKKRQKMVSFDEDDDFDAVLDGASTGLVETVS